jgi:Rrf2 family protein
MTNGRFATSLHILTLLSYRAGEFVSSEYLAGSININPAIIRKELSNLKQFGLIISKEGKGGGSTLSRPATDITLSDVFRAVRQSPVLGRSNDPNPQCPVGRQINQHIETVYTRAEEAMTAALAKTTLADFSGKFR